MFWVSTKFAGTSEESASCAVTFFMNNKNKNNNTKLAP